MSHGIRRSFLFAPADKPEIMEKTTRTAADAVIFDLEDAVPHARKAAARENLRAIRSEVDFGRKEVCARVNGPDTDYWLDDLRAATDAGVDLVFVPKVESARQLTTVVDAASQLSGALPEFGVILETPRGILAGRDVVAAAAELGAVSVLTFGIGDYCQAIGAPSNATQVRGFLGHLVAAYASMGDLEPVFTLHPDVTDGEGQRESAQFGYDLGYRGQVAIHPDQIEPINEAYTPDEELVAKARDLVEAYDAVETDSVLVDDVFLDTPMVDRYRAIIRRHDRISQATDAGE